MILSLAVFFMAVVIHEFAHGLCAYKLGDPTAKYAGRLTLNPLAHIDPFGTILLPLMLALMHLPVLGWAKPVPINFWNLRHPRRDIILVGLAGPLSNFLSAYAVSLLLKTVALPPPIAYILAIFAQLSVFLAVFNLIPIPPLDGSRVLIGILPRNLSQSLVKIERSGMLIIILLLYLGLLGRVIWPIVNSLIHALQI